MSDVEWNGKEFVVDAQLLSKAFNLPTDDIRTHMQDGQITSICESGQGEDAGRWRLTFRCEDRAFRLTLDRQGSILGKSSFPVANRPAANQQQPVQGADGMPGKEENRDE